MEIHLENNQLNSLSQHTFAQLSHLRFLNLGNNKCVSKNYHDIIASQSMNEIKQSLKTCHSNYIVSGYMINEHSERLEILESKMDVLTEDFNAILNQKTKETAENSDSSLAGLETKIVSLTSKSREAISKLEVNQSMMNETLKQFSNKFDATEAKFYNFEENLKLMQAKIEANEAKVEEKLTKMDQTINYLTANFDLMKKYVEASLKANQNNEILEFLKTQDKNRAALENFNATIIEMQEKLDKFEEKITDEHI